MPTPELPDDPYSAHHFLVQVPAVGQGVFTECSGLQHEIETEEVREGGLNTAIHRLAGRVKPFGNLVLRRGLVDLKLWQWYQQTAGGDPRAIRRESLTLMLYGANHQPKLKWDIEQALPVKWSGPTFRSGNSEVLVESVEFIYTSFKLEQM